MADGILNVPAGYKFTPSSSELLLRYLLNKILGRNLPVDIIPLFDCFSSSPDRFPFGQFRYGREHEWYFFTIATEKALRTVPTRNGYYEVVEEKQKYRGTQIIGYLRKFRFYYGSGIESGWIIKEYRVHPQLNLTNSNLAVSRVNHKMM